MKYGPLVWNIFISLSVLALAASLTLRWLKASGLPVKWIAAPRLPAVSEKSEASAGETAKVFCYALLFRVFVFFTLTLFALLLADGAQTPESLWVRWDAAHYVELVERGYAGYTEDGQSLFLVFYPLYVWLVRAVRLVTGNTFFSGLLVSALCYSGGCAYLYRLAAMEYGRDAAWRTVLLLSLFPFSFFFGGLMTEGLFLLTTAAGLYHIRRHNWLAAGIWGALAAMTRMHGLLLAGAALAELFEWLRPFAQKTGRRIRDYLRPLSAVLLPFLGTVVYLGLNYAVDGDPFAFVRHQDHWNQGFMWVSQALGYITQYAFESSDLTNRLVIWIPELVLFVCFFGLLWRERGRHRSMFTLYAFATLILNFSLSWLLSAGRYLSCAIPFFLFAARLTERRPRLTAGLAGIMGLLFALAAALYLTGKPIM